MTDEDETGWRKSVYKVQAGWQYRVNVGYIGNELFVGGHAMTEEHAHELADKVLAGLSL